MIIKDYHEGEEIEKERENPQITIGKKEMLVYLPKRETLHCLSIQAMNSGNEIVPELSSSIALTNFS